MRGRSTAAAFGPREWSVPRSAAATERLPPTALETVAFEASLSGLESGWAAEFPGARQSRHRNSSPPRRRKGQGTHVHLISPDDSTAAGGVKGRFRATARKWRARLELLCENLGAQATLSWPMRATCHSRFAFFDRQIIAAKGTARPGATILGPRPAPHRPPSLWSARDLSPLSLLDFFLVRNFDPPYTHAWLV